jgi:hypothetical protein
MYAQQQQQALSYSCMRPEAIGVCGLNLLVHAAFRY